MGDFNYPNIRWIDGSGFLNSDLGADAIFANLLSDSFLFQVIDLSTRERNILDLILSSDPDIVANIHVDNSGLPSDHNCVYFDMDLDPIITTMLILIPLGTI